MAKRIKRPKLPFAPLSIAGRGAFAGVILFYSGEGSAKLIEPNSKLELTLRVLTRAADGWLEAMFLAKPARIELRAEVANFLPGALMVGDMARMHLLAPPRS